jgi:hypothetical protein
MLSKDSQEYILAWVGAVAGILGVVLGILAVAHPQGFPISPSLLAYMSGAALLAGAVATGFWRWFRKMIRRPDVETDSIVVALTLNDKSGKSATLTRTQIDIANRKVLSHTLSVGGIGSSGSISEIQIDGKVIARSEWEPEVTEWRVTRTQQKVLYPGESITRELQIQLADSFVKTTETLSHDVSNRINVLTLKVKFPQDRNPKVLSAFRAFGNQNRDKLPTPVFDRDGFHSISENAPQLGGTYRIEWEW